MTDQQFDTAQQKIDGLARSTRRGTPEQIASFKAIEIEWEDANALPQRTFDQRKVRSAALLAVAVKHGLV